MNSNRKKRKAKNRAKEDKDKENKEKWVRPKGYSKEYEVRRSGEGKRVSIRIRSLATTLYEIFKPKSDKDRREISYLICLMDKEFRGNSYREHVSYLEANPGSLHVCGLKAVPSKSCLHAAAKRLAEKQEVLAETILRQAGSDAHGPLLGDATGFSINVYADWEDAKKGIVSRRQFVKLHILVAPHGKIVACMVTPGRTHDSPIFRKMIARVPDGDGHVMLDSAYDARANCKMIYDSGRKPVIWPRKNHTAKGFNPRAEMLRWFRRDQDGFEKVYHQRSLVESVFSSMKERFGSVVAAKTLPMQRLQVILRNICYNLVA